MTEGDVDEIQRMTDEEWESWEEMEREKRIILPWVLPPGSQ